MADTIITNTPGTRDRSSGDEGAGWIIALVLVVAILLGGLLLYRNGAFGNSAAPDRSDTNINVTTPTTPAPATPGNDSSNAQPAGDAGGQPTGY